MKNERNDLRRVTLRYRYDKSTGKTTLVIDVESSSEDMPHEHRRDMKERAEELLGMPLGDLPEDVEVRLRPHSERRHTHPEEHQPEAPQDTRKAIKN